MALSGSSGAAPVSFQTILQVAVRLLKRNLGRLAILILLAGAYFAAGKLGLSLAVLNRQGTATSAAASKRASLNISSGQLTLKDFTPR